MPLNWLSPCPLRHQRLWVGEHAGREQHRLALPQPAWFVERVRAELGLDLEGSAGLPPTMGVVRSAVLAQVDFMHQRQGALTPWSREARLLHEYYLRPKDSYSMRIKKAWALQTPRVIASRHATNAAGISGMWTKHSFCACPIAEGLGDEIFEDGRTVNAVLLEEDPDLADMPEGVPALRIPQVIVSLVARNRWVDLLGLCRWMLLSGLAPAHFVEIKPGNMDPLPLRDVQLHADVLEYVAHDLRRWAPAIVAVHDEDEALAVGDRVSFLDGAVHALNGEGRWTRTKAKTGRHIVYSSVVLFEALRLCRVAKAYGTNLKFILQQALKNAFPYLFQQQLENTLISCWKGNVAVPAKTTIERYRLALDVALMVFEWKWAAAKKDIIRFGTADSSPQGTRDWLQCAYTAIAASDLVRLAEAVDRLVSDRMDRESLGEEAVDQDENDRCLGILIERMHHYDCPPVCLGRAHTALADKCAALVFCWLVLTGNVEGVVAMCLSFAAFTTDMGTEIGLSAFRAFSIKALLPSWSLPAAEEFDEDVAVGAGPRPMPCTGDLPTDRFLENSIPIPGILHIIGNLLEEVDKSLIGWATCWKQLKVLESLLADRGRREMYPHKSEQHENKQHMF